MHRPHCQPRGIHFSVNETSSFRSGDAWYLLHAHLLLPPRNPLLALQLSPRSPPRLPLFPPLWSPAGDDQSADDDTPLKDPSRPPHHFPGLAWSRSVPAPPGSGCNPQQGDAGVARADQASWTPQWEEIVRRPGQLPGHETLDAQERKQVFHHRRRQAAIPIEACLRHAARSLSRADHMG